MARAPNRIVDGLWAATLLTWAGLGLHSGIDAVPVQGAVVAMHLLVAVLLLRRTPAIASPSALGTGAALPSFAVALMAVSLAPLPVAWPVWVQALFAAGASLALVSLGFLGRSFSVLPALRGVVARGPYRWIRHPAYLGECVMVGAVCLAIEGSAGIGLALAAVATFAVRIHAEEAVLSRSPRYRAYRGRVAYRLLPRVW